MKILPMDIQRQSFRSRLRGFDSEEVRAYLAIVAEEVASLQGERDKLDQEVQNLKGLLDEHRQREVILKNTLLTAQRVSEEIKENARKQAESVVKEAEMQGDRLLELAQNRAHEVERSILDLRALALARCAPTSARSSRASASSSTSGGGRGGGQPPLPEAARGGLTHSSSPPSLPDLRETDGGVILRVRVQPRSAADALAGSARARWSCG